MRRTPVISVGRLVGGAVAAIAVGLGVTLALAIWGGQPAIPSQAAGFGLGALVFYGLGARSVLGRQSVGGWGHLMFGGVTLMGLVLGAVVFAGLASFSPIAGGVLGTAAGAATVGMGLLLVLSEGAGTGAGVRLPVATLAVVGYCVILRLAGAGAIDLIPEEAYYWSYANRPAMGYLDHPPMVSWLIGAFTAVLGHHELAVRLPAMACWGIAAYFMFRLARDMFGRAAGWRGVMLMAVLPIYFSTGLLMTPDAPLYAAWAAALYALYRALVRGDRRWWWGVGLAVGVGMLSKYTIALLGPATLGFMLWDEKSRAQLRRPEPWGAVVLSLVVFSPVIYWNATHHWVSFLFQGPGRWEEGGGASFSLHLLAGSALVLLTPIGLIAAVMALLPQKKRSRGQGNKGPRGQGTTGSRGGTSESAAPTRAARRLRRFAMMFTWVPLSVFVIFSLQGEPRLNWTGPVWLAVLPLIAWEISPAFDRIASRSSLIGRHLWTPAIMVTLLVYGGGFYFLVGGVPGLDVPGGKMGVPLAWQEMGHAVEEVEDQVQAQTGRPPLLVGMNKYNISAELAFYDGGENDGFLETTGRHLFGKTSLMWRYWHPSALATNQNVIMVDFNANGLANRRILDHFRRVGRTQSLPIIKLGRTVGRFYYRIGYGYQPTPLAIHPSVGGQGLGVRGWGLVVGGESGHRPFDGVRRHLKPHHQRPAPNA